MVALDHPRAIASQRSGGAGQAVTALPLLILFMITILLPVSFELAETRLSPNRLFLLVSIIPYAVQILSSKVGRFTFVDLMFLFHGIWIFVALIAVHGTSRIPFAGITAVELVGGYFVGRMLVRNATDYRLLFRMVLIALLFLLPFAIYENFTGKLVIPDLFRTFLDAPYRGRSAYGRWGLERVYVVFDHPILWGLFCALTLANFIKLARGNLAKILLFTGLSLYTTFLSLSSGPLMACGLQLCFLAWGWIMKGRWRMLLIGIAVGYVVIDLLSNRTPVTILIDTMTFNASTGYTRIAIFDFGWAAVKGSPIFGIGFNDWPRPSWVTESVDNFWLLVAMRYGMVGASFLILAFLGHFWLLGRAKIEDPDVAAIRIGHAIALAGVAFTMITVHVWGTVSVFIMFYVGAGGWMYAFDQTRPADTSDSAADAPPQPGRFTRFPADAPARTADRAGPVPASGRIPRQTSKRTVHGRR